MKTFAVIFSLAIICLNCTFGCAQSKRVTTPVDNAGKANKRNTRPAESPTPAPAPVVEEIQPASEEQNLPGDAEVIRVDTELVSIPVKVSDRKGRFIAGLTKENFKILEDGTEQEITYFSNEQQPFTVALVLDMSYSTTFKIAEIQNAAIAFINQLRTNDKVMVVSFDQEVHVLCEATNDRQILQRAIKSTQVASGTSLYEAIDLVINQKFKKINGRKAIVLFTDGVDTTSRKAHDLSNLSDAAELDAIVYPIQYDTFSQVQAMKNKPIVVPPTQPSPIPGKNKSPFPFPFPTGGVGTPDSQGTTAEDYRKADEYLNEMANRTGGRLYQANTTANLSLAFSNIAAELREYYSLGFYPKEESKTGKRHKLKVRVNQDQMVVQQIKDSYAIGKKGNGK